jgi:hypothetical protein
MVNSLNKTRRESARYFVANPRQVFAAQRGTGAPLVGMRPWRRALEPAIKPRAIARFGVASLGPPTEPAPPFAGDLAVVSAVLYRRGLAGRAHFINELTIQDTRLPYYVLTPSFAHRTERRRGFQAIMPKTRIR